MSNDPKKGAFSADLRPGSVGERILHQDMFPFEVFEFDPPDTPNPAIRVRSPWHLGGTVDEAQLALASLTEIASDNILTPGEKPTVIFNKSVIDAQQPDIDSLATTYGVTTEKTTYDTAVSALTTYLGTLTTPVMWNDLSGNTTVVGTTFRAKFQDVYVSAQALLNAVSLKIGADRPTYTQLQAGYDLGGGTTTPDTPTILVARQSGIRSITLLWDEQLGLTNWSHDEIQVAAAAIGPWYSLRFDGVDWKLSADPAVTTTQARGILHTLIPFGGTTEVPTAVTLYYQVRRVTKAPLESAWSAAQSVTVTPVVTGDVSGFQLTQYKLDGASRGQHGVFLDTFEANTWPLNGAGTPSIVSGVGVTGGQALQAAGGSYWIYGPTIIPFDPSKQYRVRVRARRTATTDAAKQMFYCGLEGIAANGTTMINAQAAGVDSHSSQHYNTAAAVNAALWPINEWQVFTGWVKGNGVAGEDVGGPFNDPLTPGKMHDGVRYIRPLIILNYTGGPVGNVMQVDYLAIDVFDEDGLFRTYAGLNVDGTIAALRVIAGSMAAGSVLAGNLSVDSVVAGNVDAETITAREVATTTLQALIANLYSYLNIGSEGFLWQTYQGSPQEGSERLRADRNELSIQRYVSGGWVTLIKLGGDENDGLYPFLQAWGLTAPGAPNDDVLYGLGSIAPAGSAFFGFNDTLADQLGNLPWTQLNGEYVATPKFGTKAWRSTAAATGTLTDADANGLNFGKNFAIDAWLNIVTAASEDVLKLESGVDEQPLGSDTLPTIAQADSYINTERIIQLDATHYVAVYHVEYIEGAYAIVKAVLVPYVRETNGSITRGTALELILLAETGYNSREWVAGTAHAPVVGGLCVINSTTFCYATAAYGSYPNSYITSYDAVNVWFKISRSGNSLSLVTSTGSQSLGGITDLTFGCYAKCATIDDGNKVVVSYISQTDHSLHVATLAVSGWTILDDELVKTASGLIANESYSMGLAVVGTVGATRSAVLFAHSRQDLKHYVWQVNVAQADGAITLSSAVQVGGAQTAGQAYGAIARLNNAAAVVQWLNTGPGTNVHLRVVNAGSPPTLSADFDTGQAAQKVCGVSHSASPAPEERFQAMWLTQDGGNFDLRRALYKNVAGTITAQSSIFDTAWTTDANTMLSLSRKEGGTPTAEPNPLILQVDSTNLKVFNRPLTYSKLQVQNRVTGHLRFALTNWGYEETSLTEDVAVALGYHHFSINYDLAVQLIDGSVDAGDITGFNMANKVLSRGVHSLVVTSVSQKEIWDDLLLALQGGLTVAGSKQHNTDNLPWSTIDWQPGSDIILRPRATRPDGKPGRIIKFGEAMGPNGKRLALSSADATMTNVDGYEFVEWSTGASNRTLTLPLLARLGRRIRVRKIDSGVGVGIVTCAGSDKIGFSAQVATYKLRKQGDELELEDMLTYWDIVNVADSSQLIAITGSQTITAATNYVTGSAIPYIIGRAKIGTIYRWTLRVTKTAAGTAAGCAVLVKFGTGAAVGDATRLTFTFGTPTAAADTAIIEVEVVVRGPIGASNVIEGSAQLTHNLQITGFSTKPIDLVEQVSVGFSTTVADSFIGLAITTTTASAWTITGGSGESANLLTS